MFRSLESFQTTFAQLLLVLQFPTLENKQINPDFSTQFSAAKEGTSISPDNGVGIEPKQLLPELLLFERSGVRKVRPFFCRALIPLFA